MPKVSSKNEKKICMKGTFTKQIKNYSNISKQSIKLL